MIVTGNVVYMIPRSQGRSLGKFIFELSLAEWQDAASSMTTKKSSPDRAVQQQRP